MTDEVPAPWPRPRLSLGGPPARVALIALTDARVPDPLPVSRKRHGLPGGDTAHETTLTVRDRAEHAPWFEGLAASALLEVVAADLGADVAARAGAAQRAYVVEADLDDPTDLGYLQAAWALVRCVQGEAGDAPVVVIDVLAGRAWDGEVVAREDRHRPFDALRELAIVVDDAEGPPGGPVTVFTRGLAKLGRLDLALLAVAAADVALAANLLRDLAAALAEGDLLEPDDRIEVADGAAYVVHALDDATAQALALDAGLALTRAS